MGKREDQLFNIAIDAEHYCIDNSKMDNHVSTLPRVRIVFISFVAFISRI